MKPTLLIGLGGALGALSREALALFVAQRVPTLWFWLGTFTVNAIGCFLIGWLSFRWLHPRVAPSAANHERQHVGLHFGITGFLGGFTTFSSYLLDSLRLFELHAPVAAVGQLIASVLLGVVMVRLGLRVGGWQPS